MFACSHLLLWGEGVLLSCRLFAQWLCALQRISELGFRRWPRRHYGLLGGLSFFFFCLPNAEHLQSCGFHDFHVHQESGESSLTLQGLSCDTHLRNDGVM